MKNTHYPLIIIGSGPAGLTAAIYASRANLKTLIIKGGIPGGQLMSTTYVENWPGEKSILGPKLMLNMEEHALSFGAESVDGLVTSVDFQKKPFTLFMKDSSAYTADTVIIASGANSKRLGCPGESEYWGKGVTTCAVCDGAFYRDKKVMIVGGGDTAMEDASFMLNFTDHITVVHILDKLTASHAMQQRILDNPKIKIIYNSTVTEIKGDGDHVSSTLITNQKTQHKEEIKTDVVFVAIGLNPNVAPFKDQLLINDMGFVQTVDFTQTSVPGVFAAGDVVDYRYRQAITSAGSGCMAALDAERYLKMR